MMTKPPSIPLFPSASKSKTSETNKERGVTPQHDSGQQTKDNPSKDPQTRNPQPQADFFLRRRSSAPKLPTNADITKSIQALRQPLLTTQMSQSITHAVADGMRAHLESLDTALSAQGGSQQKVNDHADAKSSTPDSIKSKASSGRAPMHHEIILRALELVPPAIADAETNRSQQPHEFSIQHTSQISTAIAEYASNHRLGNISRLEDLNKSVLDNLWNEGKGHSDFAMLIASLLDLKNIKASWRDPSSAIRTIDNKKSEFFSQQRKILESSFVDRKDRRKKETNTSNLNGATCLALQCLANLDHDNFSRTIASAPEETVSQLLDPRIISRGPIFTDENIWKTLGHTLPEIATKGGGTTALYRAMTEILGNHFEFAASKGSEGPYNKFTKFFYKGSKQKADAFINEPQNLLDTAERLWAAITTNHAEADILLKTQEELNLDASLAPPLINIYFCGVNNYLDRVNSKKSDQNAIFKSFARIPDLAAKILSNFDPSGAAPIVYDVVVGPISKKLLDSAASSLTNAGTRFSLNEMQRHTKVLYNAVHQNLSNGRLIVGQKIIEQVRLESLNHTTEKTSKLPISVKSSSKDKTTMREEIKTSSSRSGTDPSTQNLDKVQKERIRQGKALSNNLTEAEAMNPYTASLRDLS